MAIGGPLSQYYTYGAIEDAVRLRTKTIDNPLFSSTLFITEINSSLMKIANVLNGLSTRFYGVKILTLTLTATSGTNNPYIVDLTAITPFPLKVIRVTHVTAGNVRTFVGALPPTVAEAQLALTNELASSVFYVDCGDTLEIWAGSSFTVTTATDKIHLFYIRQPVTASVTRTSKVDMLDMFVPFVISDVTNKMAAYLKGEPTNPADDQKVNNDILTVWKSLEEGKSMGAEARP